MWFVNFWPLNWLWSFKLTNYTIYTLLIKVSFTWRDLFCGGIWSWIEPHKLVFEDGIAYTIRIKGNQQGDCGEGWWSWRLIWKIKCSISFANQIFSPIPQCCRKHQELEDLHVGSSGWLGSKLDVAPDVWSFSDANDHLIDLGFRLILHIFRVHWWRLKALVWMLPWLFDLGYRHH